MPQPVTDLIPLLQSMGHHDASDLHLKAGQPPFMRIHGTLRRIDAEPLSGEAIARLLTPLVPARRMQQFQLGDLDFSAQIADGDRFRVCAYRAADQMNAAIRRVKTIIQDYDQLHLPPVYRQTVEKSQEGLVLVCGVTGSGKSTTLAAMIESINADQSVNIVTIEDPVEYRFKPRKAIVSQRELGIDVDSYADGLKFLVRQDPDVILIGEMRDRNTVTAAMQAAETGHLVFASLHSPDAAQALTRILEFYTKEEHSFVRGSLASSLVGVFAQRLMPGAMKEIPLVPATEVLLNSPSTRELIRSGRDAELSELISASESAGMHNFTNSLAKLVREGFVFYDTAMQFAPNRDALAGLIKGIRAGGTGILRGH